jgi:hypothetical protein
MKHFFSFFSVLLMCNIVSAQTDSSDLTRNALIDNAFKEISDKLSAGGNGMSTVISFSSKEDTKGSRYLFTDWVKGSVVDITNTIYNNPAYFYNYDKISYHLFMTTNKKDVIEIDPAHVKSFSLNNIVGTLNSYEKIPLIDPGAFLQVIANSNGAYSAYKLTRTKFEKANFHTDGMTETGKNYDEYVDITEYYMGFKNGSEYKKVDLTKKSLSKVLSDNPKAQAYFKDHKDVEINESYLLDLVLFLNKN